MRTSPVSGTGPPLAAEATCHLFCDPHSSAAGRDLITDQLLLVSARALTPNRYHCATVPSPKYAEGSTRSHLIRSFQKTNAEKRKALNCKKNFNFSRLGQVFTVFRVEVSEQIIIIINVSTKVGCTFCSITELADFGVFVIFNLIFSFCLLLILP